MKSRLSALGVGGLLALASFVAKPALADDWNKRTEFTFSGPVQVPGQVLPAGKYVFQLAESESDRNIVQIFSKDGKGKETLVTTILAIPDYLENTPDKPTIRFEERTAGTPEAVHSWYYPGDNTGWAFLYKKETPVVAAVDTQPPAPVTPTPVALNPPAAADAETDVRVDAELAEATVAQPETPAPAQTASTQETPQQDALLTELPETSGNSTLALLSGITMLFGGVLLRLSARRRSES